MVIKTDRFGGELAASCVHAAPDVWAAAIVELPGYGRAFDWDEPTSTLHSIPNDKALPPILVTTSSPRRTFPAIFLRGSIINFLLAFVKSLGHLKYLALLQHTQGAIGNISPMLLRAGPDFLEDDPEKS